MTTPFLRTVFGDIPTSQIDRMLPHEHIFTDLRGPDTPDYARADPEKVIAVMVPYLNAAEDAGITALVECSTIGVGRNIEILRRVAEQTRIHILAPTGLYKEDYTPGVFMDTSIESLVELWVHEIQEGIGLSDSRAGFIKVAVSDNGPTRLEERNLRAAARASLATGAAVASHTIGGQAAMREIEIFEEEGLPLHKFIWVHANAEPNLAYLKRAAEAGAYVELDAIGFPEVDQAALAGSVISLCEGGCSENLLLSHDAGWFQPGKPGGQPEHGIRGYTTLLDSFIPQLRELGADESLIDSLTINNPRRVFAMQT